MSTAIKDIYLTLYGQEVDGLTFAIGSTVNWHLTLQQPTDLAPFNLAGANVVVALSKLDGRNNPIAPPIVARQADIVSDSNGTALAEYVAADTYRTPALTPGFYGVEVWLVDGSGNRFASLPIGRVKLTGAAYAPGGGITPLPAQDPLAQGPRGLALNVTAVKTAGYSAVLWDLVRCDPTSGGFSVTLPAASGGSGGITVYVQSNSANTVSVNRTGGDTISGVSSNVTMASREALTFYSDGLSDWVVI